MARGEASHDSRPSLLPAGGPGGPRLIRPRRAAAQVRWTDGAWRPATIKAWSRPEGGFRSILSAQVFEWVVLVDLGKDIEGSGWFCYEPRYLRPAR